MPTIAASRLGNLPTEVNSFVGRRRELAEIRRLFSISTLVTLTGSGGVGKIRLVIRAAAGLSRAFPDGVWMVELGELQDPALLPQTVADALGIREQTGVTPQDSLISFLADRGLLLVLDNCEHLVAEAARLADVLRRSCPELRILATSREALGIQGESTMGVLPLAMPDPDRPPELKGLPAFDAVSLFADRAAAAVPEFAVTDQNQQAVLRIVHQLDGVPLALELAAARLRTLSPDELADRLADRYQLLTAGNLVAPARHQTLRLCVDWSYHQCSHQEQELWSRISVFVGGFELDAVEGICAFGDFEHGEVLDLVASLVDKSILNRVEADERARFRMLESLREYGLERLHESGEYAVVRERHRDWYAELALRARSEWISPKQAGWTNRLDRELPNIRAAFDFSVMDTGERNVSTPLAESLHLYWVSRGLLTEGRRWLSRSLVNVVNDRDRVAALYSAVALAGMQGDAATAATLLAECSAVAARAADEASLAIAAHAAGVTGLFTGDVATAVARLGEAVTGYRTIHDLNRLTEGLIGLALATGFAGDSEAAMTCHEEVIAITKPRGEAWWRAYSLWAYGLAVWRQGDSLRAHSLLEESLRLKVELSDLLGAVWCLEALAFIAAGRGQAERAAMLLGAAASLSRDIGTQAATFPDLLTAYEECELRARTALGDRAFVVARARGSSLGYSDAMSYALGEQRRVSDRRESATQVLTPREHEVAELIATGLTNRAIATRLVISQRTVQGHVENILAKLGFSSRTQVAAWFTEQT
jgi:predicted ATPase/DNA-binding CsgD family transcriptional regulator